MTWQQFKTISATATITSLAWISVGYYVLLHQTPLSDPAEISAPIADISAIGVPADIAEFAVGPAPIDSSGQVAAVSTSAIGHLVVPVQGVRLNQLVDTFSQTRADGVRQHDAIDIPAPLGTPVLAATAGKIEKLFVSKDGGNTIYVRSPDRRTIFYYAHLDQYASGLAEGQMIAAGDVIGTVGASGNANPEAPHLHFAVNVLGSHSGSNPSDFSRILASAFDSLDSL